MPWYCATHRRFISDGELSKHGNCHLVQKEKKVRREGEKDKKGLKVDV